MRRRTYVNVISARNEEDNIGDSLFAALASDEVELEVIVLDDGSTDRTASIVEDHMRRDSRLRLVAAPPLPRDWFGKQHACHVLAGHARHPLMVFIDADVRLTRDAVARIARRFDGQDLDLLSGFPREMTGSLTEGLVVPLIHVLLLGYLSIWLARHLPRGAACSSLCGVTPTNAPAAMPPSRRPGMTA